MERQKFEELVLRAIKELPLEFQDKLENVDVLVEDLPTRSQMSKLRIRHAGQLLGLYEGVPQTVRGQAYNMVLPDKITIFQKSVEAQCYSDKEIELEIGSVIRHEIAHHFGLDDHTLRRIEGKKRNRS
jgi:predicted Zn-dependent protease with MMP-like domain